VRRYVLAMLVGLCMSVAAWSQDAGQDDAATTPAQATAAPADQGDDQANGPADTQTDVKDDSDLDEQGYENQDDDFKPSEDIPADQSVAFPTDI
jgi:hypothetical protein